MYVRNVIRTYLLVPFFHCTYVRTFVCTSIRIIISDFFVVSFQSPNLLQYQTLHTAVTKNHFLWKLVILTSQMVNDPIHWMTMWSRATKSKFSLPPFVIITFATHLPNAVFRSFLSFHLFILWRRLRQRREKSIFNNEDPCDTLSHVGFQAS